MPTIFGTFKPDSLTGGDEADEIFGWPTRNKNNDGNFDNDTLDGGAGDDTIDGGGGVDVLIGGAGDDVIIDHNEDAVRLAERYDISGGDGDDTIILRGKFRADAGVEGRIDGGEGLDTLEIFGMGTLGDLEITGVETLVLRGTVSATAEQLESFDEIRLLGDVNGFSLSEPGSVNLSGKVFGRGRIEIYGSDGADRILADNPNGVWLQGNGGRDTLIGGEGDDYLYDQGGARLIGRGGDDRIEAAGGRVQLFGGAGDDVFDLSVPTRGVVNGGAGYDIVESIGRETDLSAIKFRGVEELRLAGGEFLIDPDDLDGIGLIRNIGTPGPTFRLASSGSFTLDERFVGSFTVIGSAGDDRIEGSGGYDVLDGASGDDTVVGGGFQDLLDGGDGVDTVVYRNSGEGVRVYLGKGVGYGGEAEKDTLANFENVVGSAHTDWLGGTRDANVLEGGRGADTLDGGKGADEMVGGEGDDTYFVDDEGDRVVERAGGGSDVIVSRVSYSLAGSNVEALSLAGGDQLDAVGSASDDTIIGNRAANVIDGGLGNDVLEGGVGDDVFAFSSALSADNVDRIIDFTVGGDTIRLSADVFVGLSPGGLSENAFVVGAAATSGDHRIIYDASSGALLFDQDGSGAAFGAVRFATIGAGLDLSNMDFEIV